MNGSTPGGGFFGWGVVVYQNTYAITANTTKINPTVAQIGTSFFSMADHPSLLVSWAEPVAPELGLEMGVARLRNRRFLDVSGVPIEV